MYNEGLLILHKPARDKINHSFRGYVQGAQGSYLTQSQFNSTLKTTVVDHKMDIDSTVFLFFVFPLFLLPVIAPFRVPQLGRASPDPEDFVTRSRPSLWTAPCLGFCIAMFGLLALHGFGITSLTKTT